MTNHLFLIVTMLLLIACGKEPLKDGIKSDVDILPDFDNTYPDDNVDNFDADGLSSDALADIEEPEEVIDTEDPDPDTVEPDFPLTDHDSLLTDLDTKDPDNDSIIPDTDSITTEIEPDTDAPQTDDPIDSDLSDTDLPDTDQPGNEADTVQPDTDADIDETVPDGMVLVPAGYFMQGCNEAVDTQCRYPDEYPYHEVYLSSFMIDIYEVTIGEYGECITAGVCNNYGVLEYLTITDDPYCDLGKTGRDNYPAQCVTWLGAYTYCEWVGKRLPTEAQWEKAARGSDGRKYPWGNEPEISCDLAVITPWDDITGSGDYGCGTDSAFPIGSKPGGVSPYGLYDMAGNVQEWVNDYWDSYFALTEPVIDPTGPATGTKHASRGGSWTEFNNGLEFNAMRNSSRFGIDEEGSAYMQMGFRCAK